MKHVLLLCLAIIPVIATKARSREPGILVPEPIPVEPSKRNAQVLKRAARIGSIGLNSVSEKVLLDYYRIAQDAGHDKEAAFRLIEFYQTRKAKWKNIEKLFIKSQAKAKLIWLALDKFRTQKGKYPDALTQLVQEKYIGDLTCPYSERAFEYHYDGGPVPDIILSSVPTRSRRVTVTTSGKVQTQENVFLDYEYMIKCNAAMKMIDSIRQMKRIHALLVQYATRMGIFPEKLHEVLMGSDEKRIDAMCPWTKKPYVYSPSVAGRSVVFKSEEGEVEKVLVSQSGGVKLTIDSLGIVRVFGFQDFLDQIHASQVERSSREQKPAEEDLDKEDQALLELFLLDESGQNMEEE